MNDIQREDLQRLTVLQPKFESLYLLEKIEWQHINTLEKSERKEFLAWLNDKSASVKGVEAEKYWDKIAPLLPEETKNRLWESNHNQIVACISNFIHDNGRMPSNAEIAAKTELSRQTIHKHMKNYNEHPLYTEQKEQFRFLKDKVLAKVFTFAVTGNMRAARLYLEVIGALPSAANAKTYIKTQNNIQINNTVLNQERLKSLTQGQLDQIELILQQGNVGTEARRVIA